MLYLTIPNNSILHLQSIRQKLVHLGDLGRDAEIDGAVTDLDDEPANKVRVDLHLLVLTWKMVDGIDRTYLGDNLELLALAVLGLGNGLLQAGDGLAVELLYNPY